MSLLAKVFIVLQALLVMTYLGVTATLYQHRRDWKQTLVSDGFMIVRHPDWGEANRMAFEVAESVRMYAGG